MNSIITGYSSGINYQLHLIGFDSLVLNTGEWEFLDPYLCQPCSRALHRCLDVLLIAVQE